MLLDTSLGYIVLDAKSIQRVFHDIWRGAWGGVWDYFRDIARCLEGQWRNTAPNKFSEIKNILFDRITYYFKLLSPRDAVKEQNDLTVNFLNKSLSSQVFELCSCLYTVGHEESDVQVKIAQTWHRFFRPYQLPCWFARIPVAEPM